jgi:GTP-binding protein Era
LSREEEPRFAAVAIIGRPSAGKSTLLNQMCGGKVAIVSPVPQTTRNKIRGIVTEPRGQLLFIDTPGIHKSEKKLNQYLRQVVTTSMDEVELVLYVIDVTRRMGQEENEILDLVSQVERPVVVALNKTDVQPSQETEIQAELARRGIKTLSLSALTGEGVDALLDQLFALAPIGDPAYPEDYYTDQEVEFRISEIIREKAFLKTRDEVPHSLYVEIADIERRSEDLIWVRAFLCVERESQKGIVIGKGASVIRSIRKDAQKDFRKIFPYRIELDLQAKVRPKWRRRDALLKKMIR